MANYVQEYINKIESGETIVGKKVRTLYLKILKPIVLDEHPKYYFREKKGEKFIKFAESFCKQTKGSWYGKKIKLMLFQKAKWQAIFGIYNRETRKRRFLEIFDVRGRKNGKSTENSVLGNYRTLDTPGAEVYAAATVAKQARRVWEESQSMIDQSNELQKVLGYKVFPSPTIYTKKGASTYNVLSKNVKTFDGLNTSTAIIDEVHELARQIYDILKQSTSSRDEALISMITTAGFVREGLFDDTYTYCSKILDGVVEDDTVFPIIYELDSEEEIYDEAMWIKANPGIDYIKKRDQLRSNVARMKDDPNFANTVKVKDFNIIGVENKAWLPYDVFNNEEAYSDEELSQFDNTIVLGGFDLSRVGDITAFNTLLFDRERSKIIAITQYWVCSRFLEEQTQTSRIPWNAWVDRGFIRISGKDSIDYHDITNYVAANFVSKGWMYLKMHYDAWSAQYLVNELESLGYAKGTCLIPAQQGFKTLSIPMQILESHLRDKTLVYQNNPVTKWMFSNIELVQDRNGNYMMKKADDKRGRKIDGPAAILNTYVGLCENIDYYMKG